MLISFTANGEDYAVEAKPDLPLVFVLRDLLGRQAVTVGCGRNTSFGGCTVRINGERRNSCSVRTDEAQGCTITTPGWEPPDV